MDFDGLNRIIVFSDSLMIKSEPVRGSIEDTIVPSGVAL